MMTGDVIKELAAHHRKPVEIGHLVYHPNDWTAVDPQSLIKPGPQAKYLEVHTLGAVRDYLTANRDQLNLAQLIVHVSSPSHVWVGGPLDLRTRSREFVLNASCVDTTTGFLGRFMPLAEFNIGLQTRFVNADDRERVLRLFSSVKDETVKQALDDGQVQIVTAKAGAVLATDIAVPNPVTLVPFRTFRDIMQPASPFVLRAQSGKEGGLPQAALFEADAGTWQLTAIDRVKTWLDEALKDLGVAILA